MLANLATKLLTHSVSLCALDDDDEPVLSAADRAKLGDVRPGPVVGGGPSGLLPPSATPGVRQQQRRDIGHDFAVYLLAVATGTQFNREKLWLEKQLKTPFRF